MRQVARLQSCKGCGRRPVDRSEHA
jgi:hypothetical protein